MYSKHMKNLMFENFLNTLQGHISSMGRTGANWLRWYLTDGKQKVETELSIADWKAFPYWRTITYEFLKGQM